MEGLMFAPIVLAILVAHAPVTSPAIATQLPPAPAQTSAEKPWPPAGVSRPGAGVTAPRLIKEAHPRYTAGAMDAKIQGSVVLEAIVEANGAVSEVRVKHSLDREFGLDDEAVRTVKKWQFAPGKKDDVAVPVLVEIEIAFTLRE
jgi:periplasmic protein TonB